MKIGYALGGGGARGAAHLGVLAALDAIGIKPNLITGTSIGGFVGALYAAGLPLDDIINLFQKMSLNQMYTLPGNAPSISGNKKVEKLLEDRLGRITFADLPIPVSMVTTDLVSRKQVVLDEGDLIEAILATIALPLLLPPIEKDGMVLVDGGVVNSTPFDVVRARGATYVIAVDLANTASYGQPGEPPPPPTGLVARMLSRAQSRHIWQVVSTIHDIIVINSLNTRLAISQPEILLRPELGTIGIFDFHLWEKGMAAGRAAVEAARDQLEALAASLPAD